MKLISTRFDKFLQSLKDRDARDAFVAARVASAVAVRVFNLRKKRGWSQERLAKEAGMRQARISLLEGADYENFSFSTLRRIAAAFGVALVVDFVSFSDFFKWSEGFKSSTVAPESFDESVAAAALAGDNAAQWVTDFGSLQSVELAQRREHGLPGQEEAGLTELSERMAPGLSYGERLQ